MSEFCGKLSDAQHLLGRLAGHLAQLEYHEGIGGLLDRADHNFDLRFGYAELRTDPGRKIGQVALGLRVELA